MTCVVHELDSEGNMVDVFYFCCAGCMAVWLGERGIVYYGLAGETSELSWGAWPGGAETDADMHCGECGDFLWAGLVTIGVAV